jgi:hypothetical protein
MKATMPTVLIACEKAAPVPSDDRVIEIALDDIEVAWTLHDRMQNWGSD